MACQCRSVPLMLFFLTRLRRRLHFFDIWPCKFTPATLFRIYIAHPPPHPTSHSPLCLNPPPPTPSLFSCRICKWLQTEKPSWYNAIKKKKKADTKGNSELSGPLASLSKWGGLRAAQECKQGDYEPHRIIHHHRKFQFTSLCIVPFRKFSGCDKPPCCSRTSRLDLVILKTTPMICKIYYQSLRVE